LFVKYNEEGGERKFPHDTHARTIGAWFEEEKRKKENHDIPYSVGNRRRKNIVDTRDKKKSESSCGVLGEENEGEKKRSSLRHYRDERGEKKKKI